MQRTELSKRIVCGLVAVCLVAMCESGYGQSSRSRKGASTKDLDVRAVKAKSSFLDEAAELALQYERAGELEKAKSMLQTILRLDPKVEAARQKIKLIDQNILNANRDEIKLSPGEPWRIVGQVAKGRPFKIGATGSYRFTTSLVVDPGGVPSKDPKTDLISGIPLGALMGMYVVKGEPGKPNKPGKPFMVGKQKQFTPKEDGVLLLKTNIPPNSKASGTVQVTLSGNIK